MSLKPHYLYVLNQESDKKAWLKGKKYNKKIVQLKKICIFVLQFKCKVCTQENNLMRFV